MKRMIELTQVYTASSEYDPAIGRVKTDFALRRLLVNCDHIVCAKESEDLQGRPSPLVDGLSEHTAFTRLFLTKSNAGPTLVDVVGSLDQITEKINKSWSE